VREELLWTYDSNDTRWLWQKTCCFGSLQIIGCGLKVRRLFSLSKVMLAEEKVSGSGDAMK
jgi:hypothetical protein